MNDKINLLLDLDNTLICAEPYEDLSKEEINKYKRKFKYHNMDDYYLVCERPHVQEFLDFCILIILIFQYGLLLVKIMLSL